MTKRTRKVSLARLTTAERWARDGKITPELARRVGKNAEERLMGEAGTANDATVLYLYTGPIAWLKAHKQITQLQFEAAERLRRDYENSGLDPMQAIDYAKERVDGGQHKGAPEFRQEALSGFHGAAAAFRSTAGIWRVVTDVVLRDVALEDVSSIFHSPNRKHQASGNRALLLEGLNILVRHYGW